MTVLSDRQLRERLPEIISPYDEARIQPCSFDVALGTTFRVFDNHNIFFVDLADPKDWSREVELSSEEQMTIHPGDFLLASTEERVKIPDDLCAQVHGKSSVGRLGLVIQTAGWVDAGFNGVLTLELVNLLRVPIVVRPGMLIAQLSFHMLTSPAEKPYSGKYQFDDRVAPSRYGATEGLPE